MTGWYLNSVPSQFENIRGLGRPMDVFIPRRTFSVRYGPLLVALIAILAALIVLGWGAFQTYSRYYRNGPAVIWRYLTPPIIAAAILIVVGIIAAWIGIRRLNRTAVLYENGFAYSTLRGVSAWRWEDISSVQTAITQIVFVQRAGPPTHTYIITRRNGDKVVLDDTLERVDQLGNTLREKVTPFILARYSQAFENGQTLLFGPVQLTLREGVRIGSQVYDWSQLEELAVSDGLLRVRLAPDGKEPPSAPRVMVYQIPNLDVLLSIANKR